MMKHLSFVVLLFCGGLALAEEPPALGAGSVCRALLQSASPREKKRLAKHLGRAHLYSPAHRPLVDGEASAEARAHWHQFLQNLQTQAVQGQAQRPFLELIEKDLLTQLQNMKEREFKEAQRALVWLEKRYGLRTLERFEQDWQNWQRVYSSIEARFRRSHETMWSKFWHKLRYSSSHHALQQAQKKMQSYRYDVDKLRPISTKANIWKQIARENILEKDLNQQLAQIRAQMSSAQAFANNPLLQDIISQRKNFDSLYAALSSPDFSLDDRLNMLLLVVRYVLDSEAGAETDSLQELDERSSAHHLIGDLWRQMLQNEPEATRDLVSVAQFMQQDWLYQSQQEASQQMSQHTQQMKDHMQDLAQGNKNVENSISQLQHKSKSKVKKIAYRVLLAWIIVQSLYFFFGPDF